MDDNQDFTREEKISKTMMGNQNAVKWSLEVVDGIIHAMIEDVVSDLSIRYLGTILAKHELHHQAWSYWLEKFKEESVSDKMAYLQTLLESRVVEGGLEGKLNPGTVALVLKAHHKWKEKTEIDHKHEFDTVQINIDLK